MYMHMESLYKVNGSLYMRVLRSGGKLKIPYTLAFVRGQEYIIYRQLRNLSWSERGQTDKEPSWRIRMKKQEISFCDMFCGNQIKTLEEGKDDFIIFRADGAVSYQLAASADDGIMQVTHVFRGNDLLPSTFYQIYLLRKLGYQIPLYGHLPLLVDKYGIRLSKRQGGITIRELRANGKSPGEIIGRMLYWSGAVKIPLSVNARAALINIPFNTCTRLGSAYIVAE